MDLEIHLDDEYPKWCLGDACYVDGLEGDTDPLSLGVIRWSGSRTFLAYRFESAQEMQKL